ncbi:MAG: hypothetical protein JF614_11050 [Acidobacteria bacterium]|nr:hypothetical protein [Acidobacteriota bacterium]
MNRVLVSCLLVAGLVAGGAAYAGRTSIPDRLTAGRANQTVSLPGLVSDTSRTTDLNLVNLAGSAATCTVSLVDADGAAIGEAATVALQPRSQRSLADVFSRLGASGVSEAQAAVSCTREFYAWAVIPDRATGRASVVKPVAAEAVADKRGGNSDGKPCGTGILCFERKGVVHRPTPEEPVKRLAFAVPPGTYKRVKMGLDVTVGPWFTGQPDGKHLIYWFVLNKNFDMLGMLYFRGPDSYTALARYGIHLLHPDKLKLVKPFQAVPGHTYRCENDLDMAGGTITITVTDRGTGQVTKLVGAANVSQLTTKAKDKFLIDMAFPEDVNPDEVPGYGWTYANVQIQAYTR